VNPAVGAMSAEQLTGPWIVATIQGISVPLAVDTFCLENLISLKLAAQFGGDVKEGTSGNLAGLGRDSLGVVGTTVVPIQLGTVLKNCEFKVVRDMDNFCFLGWREQRALGVDIFHSRQVVGFQGQEIPFTCSFSKAQGCAAAVHSDAPSKMIEFTVKLVATIVVPSGANLIALGDVVGANVPTKAISR
jgi:hypothetical protein